MKFYFLSFLFITYLMFVSIIYAQNIDVTKKALDGDPIISDVKNVTIGHKSGLSFIIDSKKYSDQKYGSIVFLFPPYNWEGEKKGLDVSKCKNLTFESWGEPISKEKANSVILKVIIGLEPKETEEENKQYKVGELTVGITSKHNRYTIPYNREGNPANTRGVIFAFEQESNPNLPRMKIFLLNIKFE